MHLTGFWKKKSSGAARQDYDRENEVPVIRASICNGEQVAGFRNIRTGHFSEVTVIRSDADLREFAETYGLGTEDIRKEY
ncbi:MAG: aspartate dehydrogenase [Lachnospiraceae bacterium]|nr:aspartate dehydrogenase [Lachnospiraceae bacterium]